MNCFKYCAISFSPEIRHHSHSPMVNKMNPSKTPDSHLRAPFGIPTVLLRVFQYYFCQNSHSILLLHANYSYYIQNAILLFMHPYKKQKISIQKLDFAPQQTSAPIVPLLKAKLGCKLPGRRRPPMDIHPTDQYFPHQIQPKLNQKDRPTKSHNSRLAYKPSNHTHEDAGHQIWQKNKIVTQPIDKSQADTVHVLESMEILSNKYNQINAEKNQSLRKQENEFQKQLGKVHKNNSCTSKKEEGKSGIGSKIEEKEEYVRYVRNRSQSVLNAKPSDQPKKCPFSTHKSSKGSKFRPIKELKQENLVRKWLNVEQVAPSGETAKQSGLRLGVGQLKVSDLVQALFVKSILQKEEVDKGKVEKMDAIIKQLYRILKKQNRIPNKLITPKLFSPEHAKYNYPNNSSVSPSKNLSLYKYYLHFSHQTNAETTKSQPHKKDQKHSTNEQQKTDAYKKQQIKQLFPQQDDSNPLDFREKHLNQLKPQSKKQNDVSKLEISMFNSLSMSLGRNRTVESMHMRRNKMFSMYRNLLSKTYEKNRKMAKQTRPYTNNSTYNSVSKNDEVSPPKPHTNFLRKGQGRYAQIIDKISLNLLSKSKQSSLNQSLTEKSLRKTAQEVIDQQPQIIATEDKIGSRNSIQRESKTQSQPSDKKNSLNDEEIERIIMKNRELFGQPQDYTQNASNKMINKSNVLRLGVRNRRKESINKTNGLETKKNRKSITEVKTAEIMIGLQKRTLRKRSFRGKTMLINKYQESEEACDQKGGFLALKNSALESQLRKQQDELLNQLYERDELREAGKLGEEIKLYPGQLRRIGREKQKEGQDRVKQLKQLKQQFRKMLHHRVNIEGPSVFCRIGADRNNKIGLNGLCEFESIYMLKKPKYLESSYSIKSKCGSSCHSFSQDSFLIDFMKTLCSQAGRLGQKQIET